MKLKNAIKSTALTLGILAALPATASELVADYATTSSGTNWVTSSGDCWRMGKGKTDVKDGDCGYKEPVKQLVMTDTIKLAETAGSRTQILNGLVGMEALVLFDFDSSELSIDGKTVLLERIAKFKGKVTSDIPVQITGHTDSTGPEEYNQRLSEQRAATVAEFVKNNTFLTDHDIRVEGKGEFEPVESNQTTLGRSVNRRVDILFLGHEK